MVAVDVKYHEKKKDNTTQNSVAVWTGRWAWALIPYPILPPSLISPTVSVDIKHHERRRWSGSIYSHKNMEWKVNETLVFEEVGSLIGVLFHQGLHCRRVHQKAKSITQWDWTVHDGQGVHCGRVHQKAKSTTQSETGQSTMDKESAVEEFIKKPSPQHRVRLDSPRWTRSPLCRRGHQKAESTTLSETGQFMRLNNSQWITN